MGKNKLADRLLQLLCLPRHYIQLHRDTTVQSLTVSPSVVGGVLHWEDSPLVKAVSNGHVLVVDEVDKAPVEVVGVLKVRCPRRPSRRMTQHAMVWPAGVSVNVRPPAACPILRSLGLSACAGQGRGWVSALGP